ncbi:hypothetical protein IV500_05030 [Paeniglutamicibacter antarcticus]|uniref:Uncharacterized protein n=1 Tax=Arthrobacter terrae TaxID=2935737 RepID=A0A931CKS9_9MICC|nr:hypothetical protein [Arthrobacter terrae]MBG0738782.1 hypothetical protein [Arthrobacter terrae]
MTAVLDFVDTAAVVLAGHPIYTWNKSGTRIRCVGQGCGAILDSAGGDDGATLVFARHQAEQLPSPFGTETPAPVTAVPVPDHAGTVEPEPEPARVPNPAINETSGEPVETAVEEKTLKIRRDTKALAATIAEVKKGDRVTASFKHPRYGDFAVEGTVIKGGAGVDNNQLIVGGWYINLNERAGKYLQELIIVAAAGSHEFAIPKPSEATEHVGIGG